jgi:hypothetical protein
LLGCQAINNNTGIVKTLALSEQLRVDLHNLVKESLRLMETTPESSSGLLTKVLFDTLDTLNPRHLTALLLSDLELYRDLHKVVGLADLADYPV